MSKESEKEILLSGKLVGTAWNGFWSKVKPKQFPPEQHAEMRKAFICGFFCCFCSILAAGTLTEEEGKEVFDKVDIECRREIKKFGL